MESAEALRSIISSQKAIAAAELLGFERASASIEACVLMLERAVQAVLLDLDSPVKPGNDEKGGKPRNDNVKIIIGSDLGLVGRFNRSLAGEVAKEIARGDKIIALGRNMASGLVAQGVALDREIAMPGDADGIVDAASDILESLGTLSPTTKVEVFFNKRFGSLWQHERRTLAPITREYLAGISAREWPTRSFPGIAAPRESMLDNLMAELVLYGVCMALSASLAAEQLARLITTQNAEKNIDEKIESMTLEYQQRRQAEITEELIDVLNGASAIAA